MTALLIGVLLRVAPTVGLVQAPGGHRRLAIATPVVGDIPMFCGFAFAALMIPSPLGAYRALFAASALVVITGFLDDAHELPTGLRFLAQIVAAVMMAVWGGVVLHDFGALVGSELVVLGAWAVPLTVFAAVGVMNAINMSDGLDGQAGGLGGIVVAFLMFFAWRAGAGTDFLLLSLVLVCVAVFLAFNAPFPRRDRPKTFMGDAGSMFLGLVLVWFLVKLSQEPRAMSPVTALWLVALPLVDTVAVLLRRLLQGRSPFGADRTHYHHILRMFGLSKRKTLAAIVLAAFVLAVTGTVADLSGVAERYMFGAFLAVFAVYFMLSGYVVRAASHRRVVFGVRLSNSLGDERRPPHGEAANQHAGQISRPPGRP